ncbi:MAG: hypothetical protein Q7K16_02915 [Candidatus Azambacteria bacterium]|nr:hypothetical protein [Candidatus Azambacteria bacterium]
MRNPIENLESPKNTDKIEKKDLSEMKDRLALIIKQISGKKDVVVKTELLPGEILELTKIGQDPQNAWFQRDIKDPKTGEVTGSLVRIPEKIFESSEEVAKGKAAHEAGHVAITRFGRFVPDKVLQELGFHHLLLAVEELPTDQVVRDRYAGAGRWIDQSRKDSAVEGEILYKTKNKLGYIPKSSQLNDLFVYGRHYEEITDRFDQGVIDLYKKLKIHLDEIENTLPPEGAPEKDIIEQSKERYRITYKKLWPEVKKLVEEDLERERLRQMLQQAEQGNEGQGDEKESTAKDQESLENQAKEALKSLGEEFQKELKKSLEEFKEAISEAGEEAEEEVPMQKPGDRGSVDTPIPMDKFSEKLIEALQKAYDKLPKNLKKALEERAQKVLKEIEDQFVSDLSPELAKGGETHEEYEERVEGEKREAETKEEQVKSQRMIQKEIQEIERHQAALASSKEIYEKTYQELRELDEQLYRELEEIFIPNIKRTTKLKSSGSKINLPAVFRWESGRKGGAGQIDSKIFESVHLPEKKDYVFTLLNDLSGSMSEGGKSVEDFKAKILFAEVLNRLGVKNEILGFQDQVINFKKFDEELTDDIRKKLSGMLLEVYNKNPNGHNKAEENYDGPCLLEASRGLEAQPGKEKFLIVISDGLPTGPHNFHKDPGEYLTKAVETILKNTNQKLIGLGLGSETEHVNDFYPTSFPNISVEQLSGLLSNLLKDMIINPQKYSYEKPPSYKH